MWRFTSGPTPQVASSAVHMSAQANKERKKRKRGEKKKEEKKEHRAGFEPGSSASQTVSLTTRTCTFLWRANKDGGNSRGFALLWEKTDELSDNYFVKL